MQKRPSGSPATDLADLVVDVAHGSRPVYDLLITGQFEAAVRLLDQRVQEALEDANVLTVWASHYPAVPIHIVRRIVQIPLITSRDKHEMLRSLVDDPSFYERVGSSILDDFDRIRADIVRTVLFDISPDPTDVQ